MFIVLFYLQYSNICLFIKKILGSYKIKLGVLFHKNTVLLILINFDNEQLKYAFRICVPREIL